MTFYNAKKIVGESWKLLLAMTAISVISGFILQTNAQALITLPILFLIMPPLLDSNGDISSLVSSKINTELQLGNMKTNYRDPLVAENLLTAVLLKIGVVITITVAGNLLAPFFGVESISFYRLFLIVLLTGLINDLVLSTSAVPIAFQSFKRNVDPNSITSPILATFSDLIGVYILVTLSRIL